MSRSSTRAGVAAIACVFTLAGGCGVHPGAAADVNGTRIALDEVDRYTSALCDASSAFAESQPDSPGAEPPSRQELRQQVVGVLVRLELARDAVEELDVEVSEADIAADEDSLPPVIEELDGEQREQLVELFGKSQELSALSAALGEYQEAPDPVAAGQQYVEQRVLEADITVDPRIGLDSALEAGADANLSVSGGDEQDLSPAQTCG